MGTNKYWGLNYKKRYAKFDKIFQNFCLEEFELKSYLNLFILLTILQQLFRSLHFICHCWRIFTTTFVTLKVGHTKHFTLWQFEKLVARQPWASKWCHDWRGWLSHFVPILGSFLISPKWHWISWLMEKIILLFISSFFSLYFHWIGP